MNHAHPNVLVFFTDQQRWDTTGLHGNPLELTPNLDRIARAGTHAPLAFTPQPVCGPARSCMQTGQYATRSGCYKNGIPIPTDIPTLAHSFRGAGYHTAYIGKWHLGPPESHGPVNPDHRAGYDYWLAANALEHTSDAYQTTMYDKNGDPVELPGYRVDALTDAAIRHLTTPESRGDAPWFMFLSFLEPHHQNHRDDYPAPTGYSERYTGKWTPPDLACLPAHDRSGVTGGTAQRHLPGYYGMVKRLDEALGRVEDALRSTGQLENTIVLFTSDHGCHFKTRNSEYKRSLHDASIRVPMAFSGPGFQHGGELPGLVSLIDIPPTLLDAAHIPVPDTFQGRSLMPLLREPHASAHAAPSSIFVQISEAEVGRAVRTRRWKYGVTAPGQNGWKIPAGDRYLETSLYDLQADPWELENLIDLESHRGVADVMRNRLLAAMEHAGESPATIDPPATLRRSNQRHVTDQEAHS